MYLLTGKVSIAEFITALEEDEVKELSNLFDPCGTDTDGTKIQFALDRAEGEVNAAFAVTGNCGKALIALNAQNLIIAIARSLLDTVKARPHVVDDAKMARQRLDEYSKWDDERNCPLTTEQLEEILGAEIEQADRNFRFSSSKRRWTDKSFRDYKKRLFDRRSGSNGTDRINKEYWHDSIPE